MGYTSGPRSIYIHLGHSGTNLGCPLTTTHVRRKQRREGVIYRHGANHPPGGKSALDLQQRFDIV